MSTSTLSLVRVGVNFRELSLFAARRKVLDDDLGYALHLALTRHFGTTAPQPFRLLDASDAAGAGKTMTLLAYTRAADALAMPTTEAEVPDWTADWSGDGPVRVFTTLETRPMPAPSEWREERTYLFEALVRPVRRHGTRAREARRARGLGSGGAERDAYLLAVEGLEPDEHEHTRESVYSAWLRERLEPACQVVEGPTLTRFRRSRVYRSRHDRSRGRRVEGPEALLSGRLRVIDGVAFDALLADGVGRHGAFGYGMLLLRPSGD